MWDPSDSNLIGNVALETEERERLRQFAIKFLSTLSRSLCMEESSGCVGMKRSFDELRDQLSESNTQLGAIIRKARRVLGEDNDSYLQSGISLLWTGDEKDTTSEQLDMENPLYPSSLEHAGNNSQRLSVDALALSLVRKRKDELENRLYQVRRQLDRKFTHTLSYLLSMPEVYIYAREETVKHKHDLARAFLERMLEHVDNEAPTSLLGDLDKLKVDDPSEDDLKTQGINALNGLQNNMKTLSNNYGKVYEYILSAIYKVVASPAASPSNDIPKLDLETLKQLLQVLMPLLETDDTQELGRINTRMVDMMLRDSTGNPSQFRVANFVQSTPLDADNTPLELPLYGNLLILQELKRSWKEILDATKDSPQDVFAEQFRAKNLQSAFVPPVVDQEYTDGDNYLTKPIFWPYKMRSLAPAQLTDEKLAPVYTCATRRLFCTPGPMQNVSYGPKGSKTFDGVFHWYTLPCGLKEEPNGLDALADRVHIPTDLTNINELTRGPGLLEATHLDRFTPSLRSKVVEYGLYYTPILADEKAANLHMSKVYWMQLRQDGVQGGTPTPFDTPFSTEAQHRGLCRAAVLGAMSSGALRTYAFSPKVDAMPLRLAALFKLHQLGPLHVSRREFNGQQDSLDNDYTASCFYQRAKKELLTPILPCYLKNGENGMKTYLQTQLAKKKYVGENVYEMFEAQNPSNNVGVIATSYDNIKGAVFNHQALKLAQYTDIQVPRTSSSEQEVQIQNMNLRNSGYTGEVEKQYFHLDFMCRRLGIEESDYSNYYDDGRLLLKQFHTAIGEGYSLLDTYRRHQESIAVLEKMLDESGRQKPEGDDSSSSRRPDVGIVDAIERGRRSAVWTDALRELSVSGDKLFIFLKTLAGLLHDDVTNIIKMEDRSMERAQQLRSEQRREALRSTLSFGQRAMDTLIQSVFKQSSFRIDVDGTRDGGEVGKEAAQELVVVSDEAVEQIRRLASGTSNTSFFEAQTQLSNFLEQRKGHPIRLVELVHGLRVIINGQMKSSLEMADQIDVHDERGALDFLAQPRNSMIIRLRNETFAAIRQAYDALVTEMRARRQTFLIPSAYNCIEGRSRALCDQFAALAAYFMSQSRLFSSSASVYVSQTSANSNALMLRVALTKTVLRAVEFSKGRY